MGTDITIAAPVDGSTLMDNTFLNANVRDAVLLFMYPPTCILRQTVTQASQAYPTWTVLTWDYVVADTETPTTIYSAGSPTKLTCRTAGWYEMTADVSVNIADGNSILAAFRVNGNANNIYGGEAGMSTGSTSVHSNFSTLIKLAASDYVEVLYKQTLASGQPGTLIEYCDPSVSMRRVRGI